jgi:hypothetical protein
VLSGLGFFVSEESNLLKLSFEGSIWSCVVLTCRCWEGRRQVAGRIVGRMEATGREECWDEGGRLLMASKKEKVVGLSSRRMLLKKNNATASNIAFFECKDQVNLD